MTCFYLLVSLSLLLLKSFYLRSCQQELTKKKGAAWAEQRSATMPTRTDGSRKTVCVTGAGGFIGSWLVKLLLSRGYTVHGTVRDLGDRKTSHLRSLDNAAVNLKLFKADLLDYDAMAAAIAGCQGVFHVATPVPGQILPSGWQVSPLH